MRLGVRRSWLEEHGYIEKGMRTVVVPPTDRRKGYQYQRDFGNVNGKENRHRTSPAKADVRTDFKNRLDAREIKGLAICSDSEFAKYIDDMFRGNYRGIPGVIRMPDLNGKLAQRLHLANVHCYMLKNRLAHINPRRKGSYNQNFRIEEYKDIPAIIRNARRALYSIKLRNFMLYTIDRQDSSKVNTIAFNKDVNGNYLVTIGKKDRQSFGKGEFRLIGVGVAPTIHAIDKSRPATRLLASPTNDSSIPQGSEKINQKSVSERIEEIKKALFEARGWTA